MTVIKERLGGRIHRFRGSWRKLKLSREVMDWLKGGAPLAFGVKEPPPRRIRVISHPDVAKRVLTDHIEEQLRLGFIREVEREPTVTSPIFAIPKGDTGKWRVIIDLRYVNHFQHPGKFRSEGLDQVRLQIRKGDWMTKGDLKHGFHHVAMRREHQKFLGFQHEGRWYQYTTMPMGSSSSPYVFCRMLRPVLEHIREKLKIRIVWYVDDFLIMAESKEEAERDMATMAALLEELGWTINKEKSITQASQTMEFLGFNIETESDPVVKIPYQKKRKAKKEAWKLLKAAARGPVKVQQVARVAGLCQALTAAISVTPIFIRNLMRCIPKDLAKEDWKSRDTSLSQKAVEDLTSWLEILYTWKGEWLIPQPFDVTINTDSSDYGWGAIINKTNDRLRGTWDHHWREKHINVKELQTVMELVRRRKEILRGKTILLRTDNKVAMAYLNRMTGRIPELAEIARNITMTLKEVDARIQAVYIGTKENKIADELSRETDPHRWEVKRKVFQVLERHLGPHTID